MRDHERAFDDMSSGYARLIKAMLPPSSLVCVSTWAAPATCTTVAFGLGALKYRAMRPLPDELGRPSMWPALNGQAHVCSGMHTHNILQARRHICRLVEWVYVGQSHAGLARQSLHERHELPMLDPVAAQAGRPCCLSGTWVFGSSPLTCPGNRARGYRLTVFRMALVHSYLT